MVVIVERVLVAGQGSGELLDLVAPLSFWGGVDPATGRIVDGHHPLVGESVSGRVISLPHGKGSSSGSSVLAEMVRLRTAPAGILLSRTDTILVIGSLVARSLYGRGCPIAVVRFEGDSPGYWSFD
jgi:hypothetical protein